MNRLGWTVLALALVWGSVAAAPAARPAALATVVHELSGADYGERADFARLALDEIIAAYEAAAQGSDASGPVAGDDAELRRWRTAADAFVQRLRRARLQLDQGADVQLALGADGAAVLFIDRRPVLLSGPDGARDGVLQQTVLTRFCSLHACAANRFAGNGFDTPSPQDRPGGEAHWTFAQNQRPSFVTEHGVRFVFTSISARAQKERLSRQLGAELRQLVGALRAEVEAGRPVHWRQLRLYPRHNGSLEQLALSRRGDALSVSLPLLAHTPALWREALPWVRAQVQGTGYPLTLHQAYLLVDRNQPDTLYGARR